MIVFDLRCDSDHHFEIWFGSSADYEDQRAKGLVACPYCQSVSVEKAVMAPRIATGCERDVPANPAELMRKLATMQRKMLEQSRWVGGNFAEEARALHEAGAHDQAIHGTSTAEEAQALRDDGIAAMPLLFDVVPPEAKN